MLQAHSCLHLTPREHAYPMASESTKPQNSMPYAALLQAFAASPRSTTLSPGWPAFFKLPPLFINPRIMECCFIPYLV